MEPQIIYHKRGSAFVFQATYSVSNLPVNLDGYVITSQIRDSEGNLVADLVVTMADQGTAPGQYSLNCDDTTEWMLGDLRWDIRYLSDSRPVITETLIIRLVRQVTEAT